MKVVIAGALVLGFLAGALCAIRRLGRGAPHPEDYRMPPSWRPQPD